MSHIPQRKEKDCLNCGATVQGRYCHICGQENVVPQETFWHMVTHFFYDMTHFDSSFFHTVHHLIFRPGFLSKEYIAGRRARYLHPIRMYVFTSAIFFLLFFGFFSSGSIKVGGDKPLPLSQRESFVKKLQKKLEKDPGNIILKEKLLSAKDTTKPLTFKQVSEADSILDNSFTGVKFRSFEEYDAAEKKLSPSKRDNWFVRRLTKKGIDIENKYREDPDELLNKFKESILHRLPYMLFVSLPLFALILKLVYIRRKKFYYADHGVLTIHQYVFTFILLLAVFGLNALETATGWGFLNFGLVLLFLLLLFYTYKAMRNFYGQGRLKTFIKFLIVTVLSLVMVLVLFVAFMFFSAITL